MRKSERFHGWVDDGTERTCDHPDCTETGGFRAPRRDRRPGWHWFCLDHVRAWNANWDYTADMGADAVDRLRMAAPMWERETWPMGSRPSGLRGDEDLMDLHGIFAHTPGFGTNDTDGARRRPDGQRLSAKDLAALKVLGLTPVQQSKT
ncbi:hypothetical protein JCM17843_05570 [Kordiimonadales bacterium JCM 17843]|nr:hypothetical protein JCM17843_05570 [Kordiimonadales bacterium JCM 17843]